VLCEIACGYQARQRSLTCSSCGVGGCELQRRAGFLPGCGQLSRRRQHAARARHGLLLADTAQRRLAPARLARC